MKRQALTLGDVLVSSTIMLVGLGILSPVFVHARDASRAATCLQNLGRVSQAVLLYSEHNEGGPPPGPVIHGDSENDTPYEEVASLRDRAWTRLVGITDENLIILNCPDFIPAPPDVLVQSSYALNGCHKHNNDEADKTSTIMIAEVAVVKAKSASGQRDFVIEPSLHFPDSYLAKPGFNLSNLSNILSIEPIGEWGSLRHGGKAHYVMADGHVAIFAPSQIMVPRNTDICNIDAREWAGPKGGPKFATMSSPKARQ